VQAGVALPADPLLLIMGALVGDGRYSFWLSVLIALTAAISGDYLWYELGRRRGFAILSLLCKFSLEPDACVRKTETGFAKRGAWTLVFAKFIPGMSLVSMPIAGAIRMPRIKFLLADAAGCLMWTSAYLFLGRLFHSQVDAVVRLLGLYGRRAGVIVTLLIATYVAYRYIQRRRFLRQLRINRITAEDALAMMQRGRHVTVVDLRNAAEIAAAGQKIAGAIVLRPDDLRDGSHGIPEKNDIILYCSCPNEITSARVALQLKRAGIYKVHPLAGGFEGWTALNLPVESVNEPVRS
jgi:membrane protein DedA with SNARE-associated domain/rhodanese-related sulfurtransferase